MTHLDDDRDFDRELRARFDRARAVTQVPEGFTARVMERVSLAPRAVLVAAPEPAYAFWLRAAASPPVVLACVMAGFVAAWPVLLVSGARSLAFGLGALLAGAWGAVARASLGALPALHDPLVVGVLAALAIVPLVLLGRDAARAAERLTVRLAGRGM
jgi:hypothetical protein